MKRSGIPAALLAVLLLLTGCKNTGQLHAVDGAFNRYITGQIPAFPVEIGACKSVLKGAVEHQMEIIPGDAGLFVPVRQEHMLGIIF